MCNFCTASLSIFIFSVLHFFVIGLVGLCCKPQPLVIIIVIILQILLSKFKTHCVWAGYITWECDALPDIINRLVVWGTLAHIFVHSASTLAIVHCGWPFISMCMLMYILLLLQMFLLLRSQYPCSSSTTPSSAPVERLFSSGWQIFANTREFDERRNYVSYGYQWHCWKEYCCDSAVQRTVNRRQSEWLQQSKHIQIDKQRDAKENSMIAQPMASQLCVNTPPLFACLFNEYLFVNSHITLSGCCCRIPARTI